MKLCLNFVVITDTIILLRGLIHKKSMIFTAVLLFFFWVQNGNFKHEVEVARSNLFIAPIEILAMPVYDFEQSHKK